MLRSSGWAVLVPSSGTRGCAKKIFATGVSTVQEEHEGAVDALQKVIDRRIISRVMAEMPSCNCQNSISSDWISDFIYLNVCTRAKFGRE